MPTQKSLNFSSFLNFYQHAKNQHIPSVQSSDIVNFRVPSRDWPYPFLAMLISKIFNHLFISVNLCNHTKNQLILSVHSGDTVNFRVQRLDWPHSFLTMPNQKKMLNFYVLWICIDMQRITLFHQFVLEKWLI